MNYTWEAVLQADHNNMRRENLRFLPSMSGSPYTEVAWENINTDTLKEPVIEVNPLYRYAQEFAELFDQNLREYEKTREILFDAVMHYMVQLDLRQGLSKQEYDLRFLLYDLLQGVCGSQAAEVIGQFDKDKLRRLLRLILKLYQCGSSIYLFKEVMRCMYPDSLVYASNDVVRQVLIYVGKPETEEEEQKLQFLVDMFLPLNYQVFFFWQHHFGIIDISETMVLDEMVLF